MDIIGIKPAPGDHEFHFKKVGAISNEPFKSYSKNFTGPAILQNCLSENAPGSIYLNFVVVDMFEYSLV